MASPYAPPVKREAEIAGEGGNARLPYRNRQQAAVTFSAASGTDKEHV